MAASAGHLQIAGAVTMNTVSALFAQGMQHLRTGDLVVDWLQAEAVDSAAVSMLLAWQRAARHEQRTLQMIGLPESLRSLARLYGVEELLPG
jgi:phospholipid transport system transporter-binding protein